MKYMYKAQVILEALNGQNSIPDSGMAGLAQRIRHILARCAFDACAENALRRKGHWRTGCLLVASLMVFCQGGFYELRAQERASASSDVATGISGENKPHADAAKEEAAASGSLGGPVEVRELWTGSLYSSTYRVGLCFSADGNVRGVVYLRLYNGKVDVYHIVGSVKNNEVLARHSSGHAFKGHLVSNDKVEGTITLKNGMKVQLEGKRTLDVPLAPENCAPLPE